MGKARVIFIEKEGSGRHCEFVKIFDNIHEHYDFFSETIVAYAEEGFNISIEGWNRDTRVKNEVIFTQKSLDGRDVEKNLEAISRMLQAGAVYFNATARQLGFYKTELAFDEKIIYVCDTGNQELDEKLKELFKQYYDEYAEEPYAVFTYHDIMGNIDGSDATNASLKAVPYAKRRIDADYKINLNDIDEAIERSGYLLLTENVLFGSLVLAAVDLMAAEFKI